MSDDWKEQTRRVWSNVKRVDEPGFTLEEFRAWLLERAWRGMIWRCAYCNEPLGLGKLSIDHWVPRVAGGKSTLDNLVECHEKCNRIKGEFGPREAHDLFMRLARLNRRKLLEAGTGIAAEINHIYKLGAKPSFRWAETKRKPVFAMRRGWR